MKNSREYHYYPKTPADVEQKFYYRQTIPYFVHTMAMMNKKFGRFTTTLPDKKEQVNAKREIHVEIAEDKTEFAPLTSEKVQRITENSHTDTIDFKIKLHYTYLDDKYRLTPFKGDTYLVRANFIRKKINENLLTLKVHHIDGPKKTECERIIDTIIHELENNVKHKNNK
jgi:hypothetical protein